MHDHITKCTDFDHSVFVETEAALGEWTSEENLQFPNLVAMVGTRLKLDTASLTDIDPIVRRYVRTHPEWRVSRGAKGGIQRVSIWQKKQADKAALEVAKKQAAAQLEAKLAAKNVTPSTPATLSTPAIVAAPSSSTIADDSAIEIDLVSEDDA